MRSDADREAVKPEVIRLDYAPAPRRVGRRRWIVIGLAVILGITGYRLGWRYVYWPIRERWIVLDCQKRCMSFSLPADYWVYSEDVTLPQGTAGVRLVPWRGESNSDGVQTVWAGSRAEDGARLNSYLRGTDWGERATLFLHERRTSDGKPCVVHVELCGNRAGVPMRSEMGPMAVSVTVIRQVGWRERLPQLGHPATIKLGNWPAGNQRIRFYAGQPAVGDGSRFTIRYGDDQTSGTIIGRLNDDLSVSFTIEGGPVGE